MKYLLLLLSLFLFSCQSEEDKILVQGEDGLLYEQGSNIPFSGIEKGLVNEKYIEYEVVNGEKHGYFKIINKQGKVEIHGFISHNKYEGEWKYYYPNGQIECVGTFRNDMPSEEWKWFYLNGKVKEYGNFFEGKREGEWKFYFESGELESVKSYIEGVIVDSSKAKI